MKYFKILINDEIKAVLHYPDIVNCIKYFVSLHPEMIAKKMVIEEICNEEYLYLIEGGF